MPRAALTWATRPGGRWAVGVVAIVLLTSLAITALLESGRPRDLGVAAQRVGGKVVLTRVQPAGWGWDAGVRPEDTVVSVDGRDIAEFPDPVGAVQAASVVEVLRAAGDMRVVPTEPVPLPTTPLHQASFAVLSGALAAVGTSVFILAQRIAPAGALLAVSASAATMLLGSLGQPSGAAWTLVIVYVAAVSFGASTFTLFLLFPVDRLSRPFVQAALWIVLAVHALLITAYIFVLLLDTAAYDYLQKAAYSTIILDLLAAITLLLFSLVKASPQQREFRASLRLLLLGTIVAFVPFSLFSLAPNVLGLGYIVPADVAILSLFALPASIGIAILQRQFMGITHLLRRGLIAMGVWLALAGVFSMLLLALHSGDWFSGTPAFLPLSILLIGVLFPVGQGWLRRGLESLLFHDVYDYAATLRSASGELAWLSTTDAIIEYVLERLGRTLDLSWACITLGPPSGAVYHWDPARPRRVTRYAQTTDVPWSDAEPVHQVPLLVDGNPVGTIVVGPKRQDVELLPEDASLLDTLAPMIATALQKALLLERLEEQVEVLSEREGQLAALSTRLMQAEEEERKRVALDIHDDPLQRALLLERRLAESGGPGIPEQWREDAQAIVLSLRAISAALRPPTLEDFGLEAGLKWLLADFGTRGEIAGSMNVETLDDEPFGRLEPDLELALYRVGQEALNNSMKHSGATQVRINLRKASEDIVLRVTDDGVGYDARSPTSRTAANGSAPDRFHLGIMGMNERLRPWGGTVTVRSRQTQGTVVTARVPREECDGTESA